MAHRAQWSAAGCSGTAAGRSGSRRCRARSRARDAPDRRRCEGPAPSAAPDRGAAGRVATSSAGALAVAVARRRRSIAARRPDVAHEDELEAALALGRTSATSSARLAERMLAVAASPARRAPWTACTRGRGARTAPGSPTRRRAGSFTRSTRCTRTITRSCSRRTASRTRSRASPIGCAPGSPGACSPISSRPSWRSGSRDGPRAAGRALNSQGAPGDG